MSSKDLGIDCYSFEHTKAKTKYIHFQNNDDNKIFSIAFPTLPINSRGFNKKMKYLLKMFIRSISCIRAFNIKWK